MEPCDPRDVALKSYFLGPQVENGAWLIIAWNRVLEKWMAWRKELFPRDGHAISYEDQSSESFNKNLEKLEHYIDQILLSLEGETPKFTPRYLGHMTSEISLPALLGHVCALLHNPNNTSREVSKVTSRFEEQAIEDLCKMIGFQSGRGHFTSGGTIANFEALWRAVNQVDLRLQKKLQEKVKNLGIENFDLDNTSFLKIGPWEFSRHYQKITGDEFNGPVVLVPGNKHFSWPKGVSVMGLGDRAFWQIELDAQGRLDIKSLVSLVEKAKSERRPIAMVVSVAGSTELGEVDPIDKVQDFLDQIHTDERPWHHVDAAYGGYYASMLDGGECQQKLAPQVARALTAMGRADSVTLDPHKLGYVPYACGAFLAKNIKTYEAKIFSAAYLNATNKSAWSNTLEGSRPGTGAAATWLSHKVMGLDGSGLGRLLGFGLLGREVLQNEMEAKIKNILIVEPGDLNILCFTIAAEGESLSHINQRTERIFHWFERSPNFSVSRTKLFENSYRHLFKRIVDERKLVVNDDHLLLLRIVLMNPFFLSKETNVRYVDEFVNAISLSIKESS